MNFCPCCLSAELFQKHHWSLCFHPLTSELIFTCSQADPPKTLVCHTAPQVSASATTPISTFPLPRATNHHPDPCKPPPAGVSGHSPSSLLRLKCLLPVLPLGNPLQGPIGQSVPQGAFPRALSRMHHSTCLLHATSQADAQHWLLLSIW